MVSLTGYMRVSSFHFPSYCMCLYMEEAYTCYFSPSISEEVFASNGALWWSSTGKFLAYAEFNDTDVHKVEFSWYGAAQYPETVAFPYPKVGVSCSILICQYLVKGHLVCKIHFLMYFIHKHVSPLCKEILKVSGKKIRSLFVLIHLYKNLSENELIRFWPLYDVITIFLIV